MTRKIGGAGADSGMQPEGFFAFRSAGVWLTMRDTGTVVAFSDTSAKASQVYFERLGVMSPAERLRLGAGLWEAAHALQWAAARRRHLDADEAEIAFQVAVTRFGAELARAAYRKA